MCFPQGCVCPCVGPHELMPATAAVVVPSVDILPQVSIKHCGLYAQISAQQQLVRGTHALSTCTLEEFMCPICTTGTMQAVLQTLPHSFVTLTRSVGLSGIYRGGTPTCQALLGMLHFRHLLLLYGLGLLSRWGYCQLWQKLRVVFWHKLASSLCSSPLVCCCCIICIASSACSSNTRPEAQALQGFSQSVVQQITWHVPGHMPRAKSHVSVHIVMVPRVSALLVKKVL